MNEAIFSLAQVRASFGRSEELGRHLALLVRRARRDDGCLGYGLQQDAGQADLWHLRGHWASSAALQAHLQQSHVQLLAQLVARGLIRQMDLATEPGTCAA